MNIPPHAKISAGDTIVTTGYSAYFPSDVMVGVVQSAEIKSGDNLYTAVIDLSTDYYKVAFVDVIDNRMRQEQKELEAGMVE
jgi:rod shape-determining protein MreC